MLLVIVLFLLVGLVKKLLRTRLFPKLGMAEGINVAVSTLASYVLWILGFLLIMPVMVPGFNVNTLAVVIGSLSFGVGFGLRNVADNFFSGIILLIERPIKVVIGLRWMEYTAVWLKSAHAQPPCAPMTILTSSFRTPPSSPPTSLT
ncbi:MAG: mechanosensitive ion channel [Verrucomicrobia bacterium]|nr:mechanosensitive ion channel [Verrucomicrobiota bacterium]